MTKKLLIVLFILVFSIQGTILTAEVSKKALKQVTKAEKAIQKKDLKKAYEHYKKAIEIAPEYAEPYFGIARLMVGQRQYEEAIKNLGKALENQPEFPKASELLAKIYFNYGQQHQRNQEMGKANANFLKVTEVPGALAAAKDVYAKAVYQIGLNEYTLQNFEESNKKLIDFTKIEGVDTEMADLYKTAIYVVGINLTQLKKNDESTGYLLKYIELDKAAPNTQLAPIANFLVGSNNFQKLEKDVEKIKSDKAKEKKKRIAELTKKHEAKVLPYLLKAVELKGDLEPAFMTLGNYYYYCNNLEKTKETYESLVSKFPGSPDLAMYKSFLEDINKEIEKAKKTKKKK
jgi:tetratricopeptide (TPR) repeat protein